MIVDAHCHLWRHWPYPSTPPADGASTEALLGELAANGVSGAVVVAARIGGGAAGAGTGNPRNNDDVAAAVAEHPDALRMVVDVDSRWSPEYHRPGAAERLERSAARPGAVGFTHYLADEVDGWFETSDAAAFFGAAERLGLIASVHAPPAWHPALGALAERHPDLELLLHHQGLAGTDDEVEVLAGLAAHPRIAVKVSGFRYVSGESPPYADVRPRLERLARAFGPDRLAWGSDWPVSTQHHSYGDTLAFAHDALDFLDDGERAQVFGGTILGLLGRWSSTDGDASSTDGGGSATEVGGWATDGGASASDRGGAFTDGGASATGRGGAFTDGGASASDRGGSPTDGGALGTDRGGSPIGGTGSAAAVGRSGSTGAGA